MSNDPKRNAGYQVFDRFGKPFHGRIVPDGGFIMQSMFMSDGAPAPLNLSDAEMPGRPQASAPVNHKPGFASVSVVDKAKSIANHIGRKQRLSEAYKNPSPVVLDGNTDHQARPQPTTVKATDAESAYAARNVRLANAWK